MSESPEFKFYISAGLLTAEHVHRMGSAVWEFMWLISHETREEGRVLNGAPITTSRIARELGESVRTATRNLTRLYQEGYIIRCRTTPGDEYSYTIANSKKWIPTHDKNVMPVGQKCHAPMPEMAPAHDKNVTPNKEVDRYIGRKVDSHSPLVASLENQTPPGQPAIDLARGMAETLGLVASRFFLLDLEEAIKCAALRVNGDTAQGYDHLLGLALKARERGLQLTQSWFREADKWEGKEKSKRKKEQWPDGVAIKMAQIQAARDRGEID